MPEVVIYKMDELTYQIGRQFVKPKYFSLVNLILVAFVVKLDLVVLDELGFIPFSPTGAQALFTFCSELYERLALIVTTNLKFADWVQVFGDERLTAALLDRLTHHAHIIELVGESFRFRQRMQEK